MRAIIHTQYGPPEVLRLADVPKPTPKDNEVLVRVHVTTVTSGDCRARALDLPGGFGLLGRPMLGFFGPRNRILGTELAGVVESAGKDVAGFTAGDRVVGMGGFGMGCYAEYRTIRFDRMLALLPDSVSLEAAAALPFGGTTALDFLRRGKLQEGERILINGASGGVGTAAVQLARHVGAHVTGVCSAANLELVKSIGADEVIDYTKADFTRNGQTYDVIMDTAGTAPFSRCRESLAPNGRLLVVLGSLSAMLAAPFRSMTSGRTVVVGPASERADDLRELVRLAGIGAYAPVIDRRYPIEQMVEAHRYVDQGHKRGNVVISVTQGA
jgi:NADPH:quinone reductase-like Zn-dependent oxidoreductase